MRLRVKEDRFIAGRPVVFLHEAAARNLNVHAGDRVEVVNEKGKKTIALVDVVSGFLAPHELIVSQELGDYVSVVVGDSVDVALALDPLSTRYIAKKLAGKALSKEEITRIIQDIVSNALTEAEIAYFVAGVYERGMSWKETVWLTEAMYKTGRVLSWGSKSVADKHCIGGVAGNRTTPLVVSMCAAAGVLLPKTSSRAITSPAGTADVIETVARVDFSADDLQHIVRKAGACLAWGGSLGLAPADDKLIRVERLLNVDPESQLIASIMAKKLAVGSKQVLIDIPYGKNAKVSLSEGEKLKKSFLRIGKQFNVEVRVILTNGNQPIGNGIGPVLEMIDVLKILNREGGPADLEKKSILLAGEILEMTKKSKKGEGKLLAKKMLEEKQALRKFEEIISLQGRKTDELKPASNTFKWRAPRSGKVADVNNKIINTIGRILGCPLDKSSGLYIHKNSGHIVQKGDVILTLYAESPLKLKEAQEFISSNNPVVLK